MLMQLEASLALAIFKMYRLFQSFLNLIFINISQK
jgi:hypothetical protein